MNRRCTCDRVRLGELYVAGRDCPACWNYHHVAAIHRQQGGTPETLYADPRPPCSCGCAKGGCVPPPNPAPISLTKITAADLGHAADEWVSNASLIRWRGSLLLAYRRHWSGADVWVRELREDFTPAPGASRMLDLSHPAARWGREDPRWFVSRDTLHLAYAGVQGKAGPTQQLYARLRDDLTVAAKFAPPSPVGAKWEKNWSFFEANGGELHAVHTIAPRHVVVGIEGERVRVVAVEPHSLAWSGGHLRGGASPVRVGQEWVAWFHGKRMIGKRMTYTAGLYTFEAAPPFRPIAITPAPVMHGDPKTRPADWRINNWFPCGAFLDGDSDSWIVSAGAHDRWIEIARWKADAIPLTSTLTGAQP